MREIAILTNAAYPVKRRRDETADRFNAGGLKLFGISFSERVS
jgi:hypothetical protein